ncbi:MAG: hypothetical protein ABT940_14120, partial [Alphaproteobacteria bacterium]
WRLPGHNGMAPDGMNFAIVALLPDFEPTTPENIGEFRKPGWNRKIFISFDYRSHMNTGKKLFDVFYDNRIRGDYVYRQYGFKRFVISWSKWDVFYSGTEEKPVFFVECRTVHVVDGHPASPDCERDVLVGHDLYIHYSYSRTYLEHAQEIEQNLIAFLNRFRTNGPALEVIQ